MEPEIDSLAGEYEIEGEAEIVREYVRIFDHHFEKHYTSPKLPAKRAIHAKSHASLNAVFDVFEQDNPELRHGIFSTAASYKAFVRISNGDGPAGPDTDWVASIGFAIKVFGVSVPKYFQSQAEDTQDFLFLNQPAYIASDVRDYKTLMRAIDGGFFSKAIAFARNFKGLRYRHKASPKDNPLNTFFWGVAPFRLGRVAVKYLIRPTLPEPKQIPATRTADYLKVLVKSRIEAREAAFDFFLQKRLIDGHESTAMPIEDYAVVWDEERSVPIRVARLTIPAQPVDDGLDRDYGEHLIFSPWNTTHDFRPLGSLNRARRVIYQLSSTKRGGISASLSAR
jgi:hypothetical protein